MGHKIHLTFKCIGWLVRFILVDMLGWGWKFQLETRSRTCSFDGSKNTEALIDERYCPARTCCSGDEKLWYGESELATYSSDAGNWSGAYPVSNTFDNNKNTIWHSDALTRTKTITVDFKVRTFIPYTLYFLIKHIIYFRHNIFIFDI